MTDLESKYNTVFQRLQKFDLQLQNADQKLTQEKEIARHLLSQTEEQAEIDLSKVLETERQINAFIEIARAHTSKLNKSQSSLPLNREKLAALMVQIDNASRYDPNAEKLFLEATGQLATCDENKKKIRQDCEDVKIELEQKIYAAKTQHGIEKRKIKNAIKSYLASNDFKNLIEKLQNDFLIFGNHQEPQLKNEKCFYISLGTRMEGFPVEDDLVDVVTDSTYRLFDPVKKQIGLPVELDLHSDSRVILEYSNETEKVLLDGVQNVLFNLVRFCGDEIEQILFIDPIRFNNSALGILEKLASGKGAVIEAVPASMEIARKKLASVISKFSVEEKKIGQSNAIFPMRVFYFHDFPQAYDSTLISQIQQLFISAQRYNSIVIIANNQSKKSMTSSDVLAYMSTQSKKVICDKKMFFVDENGKNKPFYWYQAPKELPQSIIDKFARRQGSVNNRNIYEEIFDLEQVPDYLKGHRSLPDIPVGVDEEGNVVSLNFENSNFATFICGASRSGKSTLLHTLLTGLIRKVHPDDVEIWLIDFKMTEFSRYIKHLPPHVRYIILDKSPELVYDIIDRLMEILIKRQNRFKENWLKLSDVPPEKYMPAIFVIIDEFSIMSNIVANSVNGKQDYREKMQTLLSNGASLGFYFIFSSQGFTSGTNGLSPFSKEQIQQRIAMKTDYNEIRETLDLRTLSDEDRARMEQLPPHYALLRIQDDEKGVHLQKMKTIYIEDYKKQEACIDAISKSVRTSPQYNVLDPEIYIGKQPLIMDGSHYYAFSSEKEKIQQYLSKNADVAQEMEETYLFPGKPKKMAELYPLEIFNSFCENLLVFAPVNEKQPLASLLTSFMESLEMQSKSISLWTTPRNMAYRTLLPQLSRFSCPICRDINEVCSQILQIKNAIKSQKSSDQYIFLMGTETLLLDMSFQIASPTDLETSTKTPLDGLFIEPREEGKMDLETLLQSLNSEIEAVEETKNVEYSAPAPVPQENNENRLYTMQAYDARNDLKYILAQGPRLGYHFILVFNTIEEFQQSGIDLSLFKHKLLFRTARIDALTIAGGAEADWIADLTGHTFRYTNGLDALSFQPYLYDGLSWDGWEVKGKVVVNTTEEEYLM